MKLDSVGRCQLESILYQRDKDKRGNEHLTVGLNIEFSNHLNVGGQTDAHQFDIIADKIDLLTERTYAAGYHITHSEAVCSTPELPVACLV